jgi:hypothetical protein
VLATLVIAGTTGCFALDKETRGLLSTLPTNRDLLFWSQPQRGAAGRARRQAAARAVWPRLRGQRTLAVQKAVDGEAAGLRP